VYQSSGVIENYLFMQTLIFMLSISLSYHNRSLSNTPKLIKEISKVL